MRILRVIALVSVLGSGSAWADPIVISAGVVNATRAFPRPTRPIIDGAAIRWNGSFLHLPLPEASVVARTTCAPCAPGQTVDLSGSFDLGGLSYRGFAMINGVDYGPPSSVFGTGNLQFHSQSVSIPTGEPGSPVMAFAPFTVTGTMRLFLHPTLQMIFDGSVSGSGTARLILDRNVGSETEFERPPYSFYQLDYTFAADAAPVPEPGSLLLLATGGLTGLLARWRRRTTARRDGASAAD